MAEMDTQLLVQTMQDLIRAIRENSPAGHREDDSNFGEGSHTKKIRKRNKDAAEQRMEKAMKEGTKALKDAFKSTENYTRDTKIAGLMFQNAVSKLNLKAFDELPKRINVLTQSMGLEFKNKAEIDKALNRYTLKNIEDAKKLHEAFLKATEGTEEYHQLLDKMEKIWGKDIDQLSKSFQQLTEDGQKFYEAVTKETKAIDKHAEREEAAAEVTGLFVEALGWAVARTYDAAMASAKYGVAMAPLIKGSIVLGMSSQELAEIQNKNYQAISNLQGGFGEFDDMIIKGAYDLFAFTGNMKDGVIITSNAFKNFRMLSSQTKDQNNFIEQTKQTFEFMNRTVGTTAEEFEQLTQDLMNNQDIQVNMYRLTEQQRTQAFQNLLTQESLLKVYGLLDPEAKAVVEAFSQIGAQGPKERLKQAAQLQAVGGALGMGADAAKLAAYIRSGDTDNPEAIKLARSLQQGAQSRYANTKGKTGEFAMYQLTNLPGVKEILGQSGPVSKLAMRKGLEAPPNKVQEGKDAAAGKKSAKDEAVSIIGPIVEQIKGVKTILEVIGGTLAAYMGVKSLKGFLGDKFIGYFAKKLLGRTAIGGIAEGAASLGTEALTTGVGMSGGVSAAGLAGAGAASLALGAAGLAGYGAGMLIDKIPQLFGSDEKFSDMIGGVLDNHFGPKLANHDEGASLANNKNDIIHGMLIDRHKLEKENLDEKTQKEILENLDLLTTELAKMNGKDPTKAIEDLHKTLKIQHQENKDLTQEQNNIIKKTKVAKLIKVTDNLGKTS